MGSPPIPSTKYAVESSSTGPSAKLETRSTMVGLSKGVGGERFTLLRLRLQFTTRVRIGSMLESHPVGR